MRLEQLRQFIAVAQKGNFRKAGRELGISQPALTRSIQNLEQYFNVPLFDRLTSGVVLTEYGRSVMLWAQETINSSQNIKRYVDLLSEASTGTLVVGTGTYFADSVLAIALSRLLERYPKLNIRIIRDTGKNAEKMILSRQIDIFLGWSDDILKTHDILVNTIKTGPIVIFCRMGHPLLKICNPDLGAIFKYPFVGPIVPEEHRIRIDRFRYDLTGGHRPFFDIEFDSYPEVRRIVELSDCIGALPESNMIPFLNDDLFARLPVSLDITHTVSISYLKERSLLPAAEYLIEELMKVVQEKLRILNAGVDS